jgi:hypothetical protein
MRRFQIQVYAALFSLLALVLCLPPAHAQTSKGILVGMVRDTTGAVVPGAQVTIINQETGETRTTTSGDDGAYRVDAISPGTYEVNATAAGFTAFRSRGNIVNPSIVNTANVTLQVGHAETVVDVTADTNVINIDNGHLSGTITPREIQTVPIFTMNPAELVGTLPGVQNMNPALNLGGAGGNGLVKISVNGSRPRANNFMIDSMDVNDVGLGGEAFQPILPDFFQNATALLNSSSAEFGRAGGAVINQVTQSGTNRFHGTVHEIYTGSGIDAKDGQIRQVVAAPGVDPRSLKGRYNQHQFGFTIGGPIIKNKLFAFGGSTWVRYYGNTFGSSAPPTVELPNAQGYAQLTAIANAGNAPATQLQAYLNNGSYLNPANFGFVGAGNSYAVSARPGCPSGCAITTSRFQRLPTHLNQPETQWMYRVDWLPRERDTINFRYLHDRNSTAPYFSLNPTTLPGFDAQAYGPSELGGGTWTHIFTPNLVNEFRVSEIRINFQFGPTSDTLANPAAKLPSITFGGTGIPQANNASNPLGVSQNMPQGRGEELYQFQDSVGWTRGRHTWRMGAEVGRLLETDLISQPTGLGALTYAAGGGASSIDNYLSDRLGTSGTAVKTFGPTRTDPHLWKLAFFIQDDVKLSPDFTLNVGVRYDYLTNPLNTLSYPAIDINNPFQAINTVVHVQDDTNNIAPRVGFAWVPRYGMFSDGKTVVHGGFGIFFDPFFTNILVNSAQSSPVAPTTTLTSTATGGLTNASSLLGTITPTFSNNSSVQSTVNNLVNPETFQYNFGAERQLPFQIKGAVNYVGGVSRHLYSNRQFNYFLPSQQRVNPSRGVINARDNRASSSYNSLQVAVDRYFFHGLFFRASYTYAKNLDNASEVFTLFNSPTSYSANLAGDGLRQEWGNSAFDRRHVAAFLYSWTPAGFHSDHALTDVLLSAFTRHITISGETQLATGPYSTYNVNGFDINGDGSTSNDRPVLSNPHAPANLVGVDGAWIAGGTPGTYYNYATFNSTKTLAPINASDARFLVPKTTLGGALATQEVSRNSFLNPGQSFWNIAAEKQIPVHFTSHMEGSAFVFRVESQNFPNHNNVKPLNINVTQIGQSTYQNVSNAREATNRHLRLWAKFVF